MQGFTLVEVLVAIGVMALMALMGWRGLDGMARSQHELHTRDEQLQTTQTALAQWRSDLDQLHTMPGLPAWDWDGRVLRLTRSSATGQPAALRVVAWTLASTSGQWLRWQSPPLTRHAAWQQAWQEASQWAQNPTPLSPASIPGTASEASASALQLQTLAQWQLYVHRDGAWTHPLSSDAGTARPASGSSAGSASASPSPAQSVPDAVRLQLQWPSGAALSGELTLDWIRPVFTGSRS
jgi:general secretion pathway protein J